MSLASYADLKAAVLSWTATNDITDALFADFVTLAEAKFNRRLRTVEMEASLSETAIASDVVARPADLLAVKAMWVTGGDQRTLEQKTLEYIMRQPSSSAIPQFYAWDRTNFRFYPSSGSVAAVYYEKIDPLTSSAVNWIFTASPDLYLWGVLEQAYRWEKDKANEMDMQGRTDALIEELNGRNIANQIGGGKLVSRAR